MSLRRTGRTNLALAACLLAGSTAMSLAAEWTGGSSLGVQAKGKKGALEGALVTIELREPAVSGGPPPRRTDSRGEANFVGIAPGVWTLEVRHPDHLTYVATVRVAGGGKPTVVSEFLQATGSGRLTTRVKYLKGVSQPRGTAVTATAVASGSTTPARPSPRADQETPPASATRAPSREPGTAAESPAAPPSADAARPERQAAARALTPPEPDAEPEGGERRPAVPAEPPRPKPETEQSLEPELPRAAPSSSPPPAPAEAQVEPPQPPAAREAPAPAAARAADEAPAAATTPEEPVVPATPPDEAAAAIPTPPRPAAEPSRPEAPPASSQPSATPEPSAAAPPSKLPVPPVPAAPAETGPAPAMESDDLPAAPREPAPTEPVPTPPDRSSLRSYRDRSCLECKPGEWAVSAAADTAAMAEAGCPPNAAEEARRVVEAALSESGKRLEAYGGPLPESLVSLDLGRSCRLIGVVLPAEARFAGFRFEVEGASSRGQCLGAGNCEVGDATWLFDPQIARSPGATAVYSVFENRSRGEPRRATLTAYFLPPGTWSGPQ